MKNQVSLIGRVGQKPENRQAGQSTVCNFSLATTEKYKTKEGETKEITQWHNVEAWSKQAEILTQYLDKGSLVSIDGSIVYEQYEKDGIKKVSTKIRVKEFCFLGGNKPNNQEGQNQVNTVNNVSAPVNNVSAPVNNISAPVYNSPLFDNGDDDLPF
jgi:single-strand DNA-binding protein